MKIPKKLWLPYFVLILADDFFMSTEMKASHLTFRQVSIFWNTKTWKVLTNDYLAPILIYLEWDQQEKIIQQVPLYGIQIPVYSLH